MSLDSSDDSLRAEYEDFSFTEATEHDHILRIGEYKDRKIMWSENYLRYCLEDGPLKDEIEIFLDGDEGTAIYRAKSERGPGNGENKERLESEEAKAFDFILDNLEEDRGQPPQLDLIVERMEDAIEKYSEGYTLAK